MGGLVVSGGAMANFVALKAARDKMLGYATRARKIPVDAEYRMRIDLLRAAIAEDRAAGKRPIAIVGTAGTVATGAIDPLAEIAATSEEEQLWFHVDGAYGALAMLAPELCPLFTGIEKADSIAWPRRARATHRPRRGAGDRVTEPRWWAQRARGCVARARRPRCRRR